MKLLSNAAKLATLWGYPNNEAIAGICLLNRLLLQSVGLDVCAKGMELIVISVKSYEIKVT